MTDLAFPHDLAYNRGLIDDPRHYAATGGFRSWLFLVGDEFAGMPGGMSDEQVREKEWLRTSLEALRNESRPTPRTA